MSTIFPFDWKLVGMDVGSRKKVRISIDPWVGCRNEERLTEGLRELVQDEGIFTLNQMADQGSQRKFINTWPSRYWTPPTCKIQFFFKRV
jgi:hypothetical protein